MLCDSIFAAHGHNDLPPRYAVVCSGCLKDGQSLWRNAAQSCPTCAQFSVDGSVCGACQTAKPPIQQFWASMQYAPPLPAALHQWKHLRQTHLMPFFVQLMLSNPPPWLPESQIDAVLAMPLSRQRRIFRGFNQCDELAAAITRHYHLPLLPHHAVQRANKPPQSTLTAAERSKNVRGSFTLNMDVKNRKILIIDDIATTGASIHELARTLTKSGAAAIYVWVVARNL